MGKNGLRILHMANAPWCGTGYGVQSNSLLTRLAELPMVEEVGIFAFYGIQGGVTTQLIGQGVPRVKNKRVKCFPLRAHLWGNDVIQDHAKHFGADIVITLVDIWTLEQPYWMGGFRWCPWMPIDHDPVPPKVEQHCRMAYMPITYAKFAHQQLSEHGIENVYIPHGVETDIYRPLSRRTRRECKRLLRFDPDDFVVGGVMANKGFPPRKAFPWILEAMRPFMERHQNVKLYLHSLATGEMGGPDLREMAATFGIPGDRFRLSEPYYMWLGLEVFDAPMMNRLYNAFDVLISTTMGEGFGLPIIEAQAAGTPVIVGNWTAMPELVGAGWTVNACARFWTPMQSFQFIPDPRDILDKLELAYERRYDDDLKRRAREFAMQYDWELLVRNHWAPFLERVWDEVQVKTFAAEYRVNALSA